MSIVPLTLARCPEVARLHLENLQTGFRGKPGLKLLEAYYATLVQSEGGTGFVAEGDGEVVGYVCGLWETAEVRAALLKTRWPALIYWGIAQAVTHRSFLSESALRLKEPGQEAAPAKAEYELRPLVVARAARGRGIGTQLVEALLADAQRRGFCRVHLFAEENNDAANAFYRRIGFQPMAGERSIKAGQIHYEYRFSES